MENKESNQIIQIRKKGGLENIRVDKGHRLRPELYYQKYKDQNADGIPMGEYREGMILDSKHFISPHWDDIKKRWPWGSTTERFVFLVDKMRLKYEDGKNDGLIKAGKVEERINDFYDPIFRHSAFYGKKYLQDSRGSFDFSDPKQEFLYWSYKGSTMTVDKSDDRIISKYSAGAKYELVSPQMESTKKVKSTLREIDARKYIGQLYGDEPKIRAICMAMDLPAYRPRVDIQAAWLMLDEVSKNTTKTMRYNGKTEQEMFLECCEMENEDLNLMQKVVVARKKGHIRKWADYYTFDGEKIHVKNNNQLVKYFKDSKNQEILIKLLHLLEEESL